MRSERIAKVLGDTADPRERLREIFGESSASGGPPPAALEWAVATVDEAGLSGEASEVETIACLRRAQPRLTLRAAVYLARHVRR